MVRENVSGSPKAKEVSILSEATPGRGVFLLAPGLTPVRLLVAGLLVCWFCWFVGLLVCWFVVCWFVGLLVGGWVVGGLVGGWLV